MCLSSRRALFLGYPSSSPLEPLHFHIRLLGTSIRFRSYSLSFTRNILDNMRAVSIFLLYAASLVSSSAVPVADAALAARWDTTPCESSTPAPPPYESSTPCETSTPPPPPPYETSTPPPPPPYESSTASYTTTPPSYTTTTPPSYTTTPPVSVTTITVTWTTTTCPCTYMNQSGAYPRRLTMFCSLRDHHH